MIRLENVSKRFRLYDGPLDRVKEWVGMKPRARDFWALRQVDLVAPRGRTLGIIGPNGAGKSTLLKLIAGTLVPTEGTLEVEGRVAALLELGAGFHPEFTGRQNIRINGQLLGMTPEEIAAREEAIIAFSELGRFIDQPLRTYSSGMAVRLGFAVAAAVDPDVLIIDEALSVGDARFSQKCIRRIRQFRDRGCTILFVSHDAHAVTLLCDEAALLDEGQVVHRGEPAEVLEHYNALLASKGEGNVEMKLHWVDSTVEQASRRQAHRSGVFQALVAGVDLLDEGGAPAEVFLPETVMTIRVTVVFFAPISSPTVGFLVRDRLGVEVYGTNTALRGIELGDFEPGDAVTLEARVPLAIGDGDYSLTAAVHDDETHLERCYDWTDNVAVFRVRDAAKPVSVGRVRLRPEISVDRWRAEGGQIGRSIEQVFGAVADPLVPGNVRPSPFLAGFHQLESHSERPFRWSSGRALFVFHPRAPRLSITASLPPGDEPVTVRVRRIPDGPWSEARLEKSWEPAVFELDRDAVGRTSLYEMVVDPTWREPDEGDFRTQPRELGIAVYEIRSAEGEEA